MIGGATKCKRRAANLQDHNPGQKGTDEMRHTYKYRSQEDLAKDIEKGNVVWEGLNLSGMDFVGMDLAGAMITECVLDHCRLDGTDLRGAVISRCDLYDVDLRGARLAGAELRCCPRVRLLPRGRQTPESSGCTGAVRGTCKDCGRVVGGPRTTDVRVHRVGPGVTLPTRMTPGASGFDLCARLARPINIPGRSSCAIDTGVRLEIPPGLEGQVRPRSGLAFRHSVGCAFGTIDADYRGEIRVLLQNWSDLDYQIVDGQRIAQLVIAPVPQARILEVPEGGLGETERGVQGFGSTGI